MWKKVSMDSDPVSVIAQIIYRVNFNFSVVFMPNVKKLWCVRHNIKYENTFNQFGNCTNFARLTHCSLYIFPIDVYYSIAYNNKNLETNYLCIIGNWLNKHTIRYYVCRSIDEPVFLWWSRKVSKPYNQQKWRQKMMFLYDPSDSAYGCWYMHTFLRKHQKLNYL